MSTEKETPNDASETLKNLQKVRQDLLRQLEETPNNEASAKKFSMFSSPRNYRQDELHCGLEEHTQEGRFSNN
ncbi:MAG: hypothetical protein ACKOKB_11555 [Bacteroidota bacterium]